MADFHDEDLRGSTFDGVDLRGGRFTSVDLRGADFRSVDLSGVVMRGVDLVDVDIRGELDHPRSTASTWCPWWRPSWTGATRSGPGCARRTPPASARPGTSSSGSGRTRSIGRVPVPTSAAPPVGRRGVVLRRDAPPPRVRHGRLGATGRARRSVAVGSPRPPLDEMPDTPGVPRDRGARPTLEVVLELRRSRMSTVRRFVDALTVASLAAETEPVEGPGWPLPRHYPVRQCLLVVFNEEWEHRLYAERDLDVLVARSCRVTGGSARGRGLVGLRRPHRAEAERRELDQLAVGVPSMMARPPCPCPPGCHPRRDAPCRRPRPCRPRPPTGA